MKLRTNIFIQLLATTAQILNLLLDTVPADKKIWVTIGLLVVQSVTGVLAHTVNPDGTPATEEWKPK